ncbi:MAG: AMP-binding protein [Alphaproteobacteria bacterium]|nr:AMP-binding protein [Alphaproteobacteria bacterium]
MNPVHAGLYAHLGAFLEDVCLTWKSETALIEASRHREVHRWTYARFRAEVGRVAAWLLAQGHAPGDRVAIVATNQSRWLVTAAAVFRVGGVVVPLDYKLTPADVDVLLGLARPRLLVAEHGLGRKLAWEGARLVIEAPERAELPAGHTRFEALPDAPPPPVVDRGREDPAAVVYSSGTGGTPKGCVLPHRAYLAQLEALLALYPMQPGQRFFSFLPTNHAIDFMCGFLAPFACGATVVHQRTLRAEHLRGTLQRYQITHMAAVPRLLEAFRDGVQEKLDALPAWQRLAVDGLVAANAAATERRPLPALSQNLLAPVLAGLGGKLELVFVGGAYVPPDLATFFYRIGVGVVIGYGLSEACTVVTVNDMAPFRADSVGPAVPGVEVRVLRAGADGVGDVEVRGPTLMSGYDGAPELTAAAFTEDGWLITGDRGWLDAAGHLHLVGRSRDMIVTPGGKNVYPEDVEGAFGGLSAEEIAVFAADWLWPDGAKLGAEQLVAVVRGDVRLPEVAAANRKLPEHKRVAGVLRWDEEFPRTASMKLKRAVLAEQIRSTVGRGALESL